MRSFTGLAIFGVYFLSMLYQNPFNQRGGGGGVLSLEKGTDCGLTAGEPWLSQPATAKKGGLSSYHIVG